MTTAAPGAPSASPPLSAYQRRRFALLRVAAFFEGSDFFALTHMLPHLRKDFALDYGSTGILFGVVNFGTMLAHLRARS